MSAARASRRLAGALSALAAAAPALLAVVPALAALAGAFGAGEGGGRLGALAAVFGADRFLPLIGRSAAYAGTACLAALALGLGGAIAAFKIHTPLRRVLTPLAVLGIMPPLFVTATGWRAVLPGVWGWGTPWSAGLLMGLTLAPWALLIIGLGVATAPQALEEDALLDGGAAGVILRVTIPCSLWAVGAAAIVVCVLCLTDNSVPDLVGLRTFAEEVYSRYGLGHRAEAAAAGWPVVLACACVGAGAWLLRRRVLAGLDAFCEGRSGPLRVSAGARLAATAAGLPVLAVLAAPLVRLATAVGSFGTLARTVAGAAGELARSVALGAGAAALCVALALPLAYAAIKCRTLAAAAFAAGALLLGTPAALVGVGLLRLFDRPGWPGAVYDSSIITLLAMLVRTLPFAMLILTPALRAVPRACDELAQTDGLGHPGRLLRVWVPLAWPAAAGAWLVSFALAVGEVGACVLVVPPGRTVLSVRILTLAHYGVYANVAALCVALLLVVLLPGFGLLLLGRGIAGGRAARETDHQGSSTALSEDRWHEGSPAAETRPDHGRGDG